MTDSGPTTVGSIVGILKLDSSQWNRGLDEAEARARKLGAVDPTIHVDAQVDKAIAKLGAVEAAQGKLGLATERQKLAWQRLQEVEMAGTAKQSTLMAAHLAATQAENAHERATRDLAAAELALAAATDEETAAAVRSNSANGGRMAHWQVIALLIAGLIPLMGPLAGYLASIGGGFLAMGAAGVLAIVGIKRAMDAGNDTGKQYRAGLTQMKSDLNGLADTSAVSMLGWFNRAVGQISDAMPMLNGQVGLFSNILGSTGNHLLEGLITALRVLNPLFVTGALYIDQMAAGFAGWAADGGLQKFADYAIEMLPRVSRALGELVLAALHLIEAMSPIGTVMLTILTGFAQAVSALPNEALLTIAASAIAVVVAFKAWGGIAAIVTSVGTSIGGTTALAGGLPGLIIAASVAFDMLALSASKAASSGISQLFGQVKTVDEYSAAIRHGDIDINHLGNTLSLVGGFWSDMSKNMDFTGTGMSKTYDEVTKLDQAMSTATPYELGNSYKQLLVEGEKVGKSQADIAVLFPLATAALEAQGITVEQLTAATVLQGTAMDAAARRMGVTTEQYVAATDAQSKTAGQVEATTLLMQLQGDAAGLLNQALDLLNGKSIGAAEAQNQFDSKLANMADHMNAAGNEIDRANTLLTGNTAAAVANRGELIGLTEAAQANAQAFRDNGGSATDTMQKLIDMKQAIIDNAVAHGENADEVAAYVNEIYKIPATIPLTKVEVDTAAAMQKLADLNATLNGIDGRTVGFTVSATGALGYSDARNSYYDGHAAGGTVGGRGSGTSDSNLIWASKGEEITRTAAAETPGVRPLLKALNANPAQTMANVNAGMGGKQITQNNEIHEATNARQVSQVLMLDLIGLGA